MGCSRGWIAWGLVGALAGCAGGGQNGANGSSGKGPVKSLTPGEIVAAQASAALTRAKSCDDLLSRIQEDVAAKIVLQAELMKTGVQGSSGITHGIAETGFASKAPPPMAPSVGSARSSAAPGMGTSGTPASAAPSSGPSGNTANPAPAIDARAAGVASSGPTGHSDTNVQVEGVDEADIVKTDGTRIYLLHGNQLFVLKSWPASSTAIQGKVSIEGSVAEMFVDNGTAVVFSNTYDQGDLIDEKPVIQDGVALPPRFFGSPFTKITLVDVNANPPAVTRQLFIEGNYLSARRYDHTVRAVIQGGFRTPSIYAGNIDYQDPWGRKYPQEQIDAQADEWRDRMLAAIATTKLDDWLPSEREVVDGQLTPPKRRCTDFYAPPPGLTDYGLTDIVSFDMHDPKSALGGALVLGASDEVYSNQSVMLLAHRDYRFDQGLIERERTVLHRFELKAADTIYSASGFVPGQILDQFSLDEAGGIIRVATTARLEQQGWKAPLPAIASAATKQDNIPSDANGVVMLSRTTDNRVVTLKADGETLKRLGMTEPLGADGETLKSSRFVGDRGYVVTFHQTDPLIVIDLAKPESPTKLGELDIPGFSDYMHPIDNAHLLTIGRDADATTGAVRGLMLQLFDVSDATHPRRTHTYKFGPNGYSEANENHKAFTFFKPSGAVGYDGLLAFPYVNYGSPFVSALEVFQVSVADGFTLLGEIDHTMLLQNVCGAANGPNVTGQPYYFNQCVQPEVRRGLFIVGDNGEFVYSISNGGVLAHELKDLMHAVATVPLTLPDFNEHRLCYLSGKSCALDGSGGGVSGVGSSGVPTPMPTPVTPPPPQPAPPGMGAGL